MIDIVAKAFTNIGVVARDIVSILLPNIPENVYILYALNKIGAIANLIDLRAKSDILIDYLNESQSEIVVISDIFMENAVEIFAKTKIKKWIIASPYLSITGMLGKTLRIFHKKSVLNTNFITWKDFIEYPRKGRDKLLLNESCKEEDAACIFHTSGTTGTPKGVVISNKCFNAMALQYRYSGMEFERGDSFFNQVPPFLAYNTILATHLPLSLHMKIIMLPDYRPDLFAKNIRKLKPNHAIAGPSDWSNFLITSYGNNIDFSFLKTMASGSDMLRVSTKKMLNNYMKRRGTKYGIMEGYGMTEVGSAACTNLPQCDVLESVGIPLVLNNFSVYDNEASRELAYGETGEICMMGPTIMCGYFNNPEETNRVLKKHEDGKICGARI